MNTENGAPVLSVRGLTVEVATPEGRRVVVDRLSFDVKPGETLCLAGESGSGKSMTALSVMQLLPQPMARIGAGTFDLAGRDLTALSDSEMRKVRGADIAMIFQEPMTSLNPVLTIGHQLTEAIRAHSPVSAAEARKRAIESLASVRIAEPERRLSSYPHELSGGMRKRAALIRTLVYDPPVILMDEPFGALDAQTRTQLQEDLLKLWNLGRKTIVFVTHDIAEAIALGDRTLVLSRAPARIAGEHAITIPRPRAIRDIMTHPDFAALYQRIRAQVQ